MCVAILFSAALCFFPCTSSLSPSLSHFSSSSLPIISSHPLFIEAAEQREIERKKLEEKATLKKLHRIIEKEKKKKKKTGHKKK